MQLSGEPDFRTSLHKILPQSSRGHSRAPVLRQVKTQWQKGTLSEYSSGRNNAVRVKGSVHVQKGRCMYSESLAHSSSYSLFRLLVLEPWKQHWLPNFVTGFVTWQALQTHPPGLNQNFHSETLRHAW